jgi:GDP-4-dehydro-6-deoxy-D-mannose reductase
VTRALVTGGTGFAGQFLVAHLAAEGVEVHATAHGEHSSAPEAAAVHTLDVREADAVAQLVREVSPDEVYHLAGVTRPASGDVAGFYDVNLGGARNILEAQRTEAPGAKLLLVGSAYAYAPSSEPIDEDWPLAPRNHYGASKAAAEMLGRAYAADGLHVVLARPFNHSGPGQSPDFVLPTIVKQVAEAKAAGRDHVDLELGNLDSVRDISDVRDIVAAYVIALRRGDSGTAYNFASGIGHTIDALAHLVAETAGIGIEITTHADRIRADDIPVFVGNPARIRAFDFAPRLTVEQTIIDMLAAHRRGQ